MRRVLVAVSGVLLAQFMDRVLSQLNWSDADLYLLDVLDTRPLKEFGLAAGTLPARSGQATARLRTMGAMGAEAGRRMLEEAEALAAPRLPAGRTIRHVQRTGIPEQEIVATAHEIGADLIVLGAAEDPAGPPPPPPHPPAPEPRHGPPPKPSGLSHTPPPPPKFPHRQLSPTVRFVVDHAPCDVLLLYAGPRGESPVVKLSPSG